MYMKWFAFFVPAVMLGIGVLFFKCPPKKINGLYGYRTTRSMKDQESWNYAHHYSGKLSMLYGIGSFVVTGIILILFPNLDEETISMFSLIQIIPFFILIWQTERKLKALQK